MKLYVKTNEQGYITDYKWSNTKPQGWLETNHGGDYSLTGEVYYSKLVNGEITLDEEAYKAHLDFIEEYEKNKPTKSPCVTVEELDKRIEEVKAFKVEQVIDEYTKQLIEEGVIS